MRLPKGASNFYFELESVSLESRRWEVRIPTGIATEQALYSAFDAELSFPGWFGGNWDAFADCIRDLEWIGPRQVVLIHQDLPLRADDQSLKTYIGILTRAVTHLKIRGGHELVVVFPKEVEEQVRKLESAEYEKEEYEGG